MTRMESDPRSKHIRPRSGVAVEPPQAPPALRAEWSVGSPALRRARPDIWPASVPAAGCTALVIEIDPEQSSARGPRATAHLHIADQAPIELASASAEVTRVPGGWHVVAEGVATALFAPDGRVRYAQTPLFASLALAGGRYELVRPTSSG